MIVDKSPLFTNADNATNTNERVSSRAATDGDIRFGRWCVAGTRQILVRLEDFSGIQYSVCHIGGAAASISCE